MGLKQYLHDNKIELSGVAVAAGLPITVISVLSLVYSEGDTGIVQWSHDLVGSWAFWLIIPGIIMLFAGSYFIYDFFRKLKEFKGLMESQSKAKFIKNLDRIEELAWRLHPKYEKIVMERKKKYKLK